MLDDQLVADTMQLTRARTKREIVEIALREMVARRKRKDAPELVGQDLIASDCDVRAVRAAMNLGSRLFSCPPIRSESTQQRPSCLPLGWPFISPPDNFPSRLYL